MLTLLATLAAAAAAADAPPTPEPTPMSACNVDRSWTLDSPAFGETVVLHARVRVAPAGAPAYDGAVYLDQTVGMELVLADGKVLDLGEGGKFYDDVDWTAPPSCEELVAKATVPTRASLLGVEMADDHGTFRAPHATLHEMHAEAVAGQDCMNAAGHATGDTPSRACKDMHDLYQRFVVDPDPGRELDGETFRRLLEPDVEAPIVWVRRSTYYGDALVWDARDRRLRFVMSDGC